MWRLARRLLISIAWYNILHFGVFCNDQTSPRTWPHKLAIPFSATSGLVKSRLNVGPALLLQLHYTHNAGLHDCRLENNGNFLVLDLVHIFLGIAAGFEGDRWRALPDRLDPRLDWGGVVAQHMQARTESDDLDRYFLAEILVILRDIRRIVEREIHHRRVVGIHLQDKAMQLVVSGGPLQQFGRLVLLTPGVRRRPADR